MSFCRVGQLKDIVYYGLVEKGTQVLLALSRYIVFYISKLYFYIFINVRESRVFSNPVTYGDTGISIYSYVCIYKTHPFFLHVSFITGNIHKLYTQILIS